MNLRAANLTVDWARVTPPLPYVFSDTERPWHELSEPFLPGELAVVALQQLKTSFQNVFQLTSPQIGTYNRALSDAPPTLALMQNPQLLQTQLISDDLLIRTITAAPEEASRAALCYCLGVPVVEQPALPLNVNVVLSRALRLGQATAYVQQLVKLFQAEAELCIAQLKNPAPDSNAARQVTPLGNTLMELLHLVVCAQNLANKQLTDRAVLVSLFQAASNLIIHLSGIVQEKTGQTAQTFTVPNARCFASVRAACLMRQITLRLLGKANDYQQSNILRDRKVKKPIEPEAKRLPPPRFSGFVHQQCPQLLKLEEQLDYIGAEQTLFKKDSPVKFTFGPAMRKQTEENEMLLQQHIAKINAKKQRQQPGVQQEVDQLGTKKELLLLQLSACYPVPKMKGSIEGLEQTHGAATAIQLSSDCRILQQANMSNKETPMNGISTVKYVGQGQQQPKVEPTEVTQMMQNRLNSQMTKEFQYCGRPGMWRYCNKYLQKALELNMGGLEQLNIDYNKVLRNTMQGRPLDIESAILSAPLALPKQLEQQSPHNLLTLINSVDFDQLLAALSRLSICAIPNTSDALLNKHQMPEPGSAPTNNHTCSVRHVREVVLKQLLHIQLLMIKAAKKIHPAVHRFVQRAVARAGSLDAAIVVMAAPLGQYCGIQDQRSHQHGLCLFAIPEEFPTVEEAASDTAEYLLLRQSELDLQKPLSNISSARRLFISISAAQFVYGSVMHSRERQLLFVTRFQKLAANYASAILQSQSGPAQTPQQEAPSDHQDMSQTMKGLGKALDVGDLGIKGGKQQPGLVYQSTSVSNLLEFLNGSNGQNNPQRTNFGATLGCTFPGYQLTKVANVSAVVSLLKLCSHILPAVGTQADEASYVSAFDVPGLQAARETVIKLCYQCGVGARQTDALRWNKDVVYSGAQAKAHLELRAMRQLAAVLEPRYIADIEAEIVLTGEGQMDPVIEAILGAVGM